MTSRGIAAVDGGGVGGSDGRRTATSRFGIGFGFESGFGYGIGASSSSDESPGIASVLDVVVVVVPTLGIEAVVAASKLGIAPGYGIYLN